AEIRSQAVPASIQSIPTNANNQDVVTMGTIAARKVANLLPDVARILAIEALCMAQAMDLCEQQTGGASFSPVACQMRDFVREGAPFLTDDRPLSGEIEALASAFQQSDITAKIFTDSPAIAGKLAQI
ncbi:MAG: aromatic amino acid lyase, partial [Pseudomonadota bacterium]